jgi:predicted GH43/DUF377 family glycosyl hydrolase
MSVSIVRTGVDLEPDPGRTIVRFFVPGNEDVGPGDSRAGSVLDRILALDDTDVAAAAADVEDRFVSARPSNAARFDLHADLVAPRLGPDVVLSADRRRVVGACFSHEYAIEGAALCNPSIVLAPHQPDDGTTRVVLSVRGVGEGHRSSIGFRTGVIDADGAVTIDAPLDDPVVGRTRPGPVHRSVMHRRLAEVDDDRENAAWVLDPLGDVIEHDDVAVRLAALAEEAATRRNTASTIGHLESLMRSSYRVDFDESVALSRRVLWPESPSERHGMEDARFVEIVDGSAPRYCATYTAFDGTDISIHLLTTDDFRSFEVSPIGGAAALGKGLALFPRRIGGRFVALSRADRETNSVAWSDDIRCWDEATPIPTTTRPWHIVQVGNCGSPIETDRGWLVLTHGVGPMRAYAMGALLLDLDDPAQVIASTPEPMLTARGRPGGYVPNVVYSCGSLAVGDRLVVPYGVGDRSISIATMSITALIDSMTS